MGVGLNHEGNTCTSKVLLDFAFLLEWGKKGSTQSLAQDRQGA